MFIGSVTQILNSTKNRQIVAVSEHNGHKICKSFVFSMHTREINLKCRLKYQR
jgi:hypothetical protein